MQGTLHVDQVHEKYFIGSVRQLCAKYGLKEVENEELERAFASIYGRKFYEFTFLKKGNVGLTLSNLSGTLTFQAFSEAFSENDEINFDKELSRLLGATEK